MMKTIILWIFKPSGMVLGILSMFLLLLPSSLFAQHLQDSAKIKQFTLEDGLSQVFVNDLLKDSNGFVWVATQDGLNRFDGTKIEQFKNRAQDSTSLPGNYINALEEDTNGNIWIGTQGNGLCWFDVKYGVFHSYEWPDYLYGDESISDVLWTDEQELWVASKVSGVHKLQWTGTHFDYIEHFDLPAANVIYEGRDNHLWIGDVDGNVYKVERFKTGRATILKEEVKVKGQIRSFFETANDLYIGGNNGLFVYNKAKKEPTSFNFKSLENGTLRYVTSFVRQNEHLIWIGTGDGLYLLNQNTKVIVGEIGRSEANGSGLSSDGIEALLRLTENQLFVGTGHNLNLVDFSRPAFKNISKDQKGNHVLNDNVVFSILRENDNLWVGTAEGGLNLIRNGEVFYFNDGILQGNVRAIVKDKINQRLWLATTRGLGLVDLSTFDPRRPRIQTFNYDANDHNSISLDQVLDIGIDSEQNIWGGTYGQGVFRLALGQDGKILVDRFKQHDESPNALINNFVHCIEIDQENNIWIGTEEGVSKLTLDKRDNPEFTNYSKTSNTKYSLSANSIYDILVDGSGDTWVGTQRGLNRISKKGEISSWTEQEQFPNDVVYSIQDDQNGKLWMGTNNGLVRFGPIKEKFTHYSVEDGIQSKEFDIHAKFRTKDNRIYLGGVGGITFFSPVDLNDLDGPQPLYFSQLRIKDQEIAPSLNNVILDKALQSTEKIQIQKNQFPFYLQFSTIDFRLTKNVDFAYKLLPLDKDWNMLKTPEIQFLNLPPGDYTLLVNGFSRGAVWNKTPLEMEIAIMPPWYATWWAYVLYALIFGLIVYLLYHFQLSKKLVLAESDRLRDINRLKNNLYTNITHEFRTPLTVILGLVETLKTQTASNASDTDEKSLELIERNGNRLLRLVNELLDLAKLESGRMKLRPITADVVPFVKYLCESFQSMAKETDLNLVVYSEIDELIMDFDPTKLSGIVSNLLSNAIKFTPDGGTIVVHINRIKIKKKTHFVIKVKDSGIGMSKDTLPHVFDKFYQVANTSSQYLGGTGIGLSLTKEFVELMDGTINVKSVVGKGSEFTVQLPIKKTNDKNKATFEPSNPELPIRLADEELALETSNADKELPLILIIEDSPDVAHFLEVCLKGRYTTLYAKNGEIGMEMAFEHIPDAIICDVVMPGKDGLEVCTALKTDNRTDHIPIILLTAKVSPKDRLSGLSHGADAYLAKPFNIAELHIRLNQLIQLRKKMMDRIGNDGIFSFLKRKAKDPETIFLQKAIKIVHSEMDNSIFGTNYLAQQLHLSKSQLYRKLKATTGKSTAIFIRSIRLQKAKELLQTSNKSVAEIGYEVGFNDPSWFSRAFKDEFGYAPSAIQSS